MKQTIRIEQVLRETVRTPYSDLVTRPTGRAVRSGIQQAMAAVPAGLALLDFSEVGLVDFSCADEVVAKLLLDTPAGVFLVLQGLSEEQLEAIEHVLVHHDLAAVVRDRTSGASRVVGRVNPDLRTAFFHLEAAGPCTAAALAERLDWAASHATEVLERLVRYRLIRALDGCYSLPLPA